MCSTSESERPLFDVAEELRRKLDPLDDGHPAPLETIEPITARCVEVRDWLEDDDGEQ